MNATVPRFRAFWLPLLLAVMAVLAGCASTAPKSVPGQYIDQDLALPPKGSLVLLLHLPANERAYRHGDLEVQSLVQDALIRSGYKVAVVDPDDYTLALRAELQPMIGQSTGPTADQLQRAEFKALALVSRVTADLSGSQLLLRTRLLTRPANLWQSHAYWDGVSRPIGLAGTRPSRSFTEIQGTGPGVSIEVTAISAAGRLMFRTYGGIALPFEADGLGNPVEARSLFTRGFLEEGVHTSLAPLQPR